MKFYSWQRPHSQAGIVDNKPPTASCLEAGTRMLPFVGMDEINEIDEDFGVVHVPHAVSGRKHWFDKQAKGSK